MDSDTTEVATGLRRLFVSAFTASELKRFVEANCAAIQQGIRFDDALEEVASEVAGALIRHAMIDADLFAALASLRPRRADEIRAVEDLAKSSGCYRGTGDCSALPRGDVVRTPRGVVMLAMQLDREKQWKHLERAHEHSHVLFVLYGTHRQSLGLFIDRIRYDLANIRQRPQTLVQVPARRYSGDSGPRRGTDWVRRTAKEVESVKRISGKSPAETIVEAARQDDLLLVLGPLRLRTVLEKGDIKKGLFQFIEKELDDVFTRHAEATSGVGLRFVLYLQTSEPRVEAEHALIEEVKSMALEVIRSARDRERPAIPHVQPLPEARFPDWADDIEPFLYGQHASKEVFEVARKAHERLHAADSDMSFARFAEILEEELTAL